MTGPQGPAARRRPPRTLKDFVPVGVTADVRLEDHRRYPLCRVVLFCGACGWARDYDPERIIDRLRALRAGGYSTPVAQVARQVGWTCPGCGRAQWGTKLAYWKHTDPNAIQRMTRLARS